MLKKIILTSIVAASALLATAPTITSITPSVITTTPGTTVTITTVVNNGGEPTRRVWSASNGTAKGQGVFTKDTLNSIKWVPSAGGTYTIGLRLKNSSGQATGSTTITVANSVPAGFIKIPGSENYAFAGQTPASGWAVMKWEAGYVAAAPTTSAATSNYYTAPYFSDYSPGNYGAQAITSKAGTAPISDITRNEAEALCSNSTYLKASDGTTALSNGHLIGVGLWQKVANNISQQAINWSGNAVGSGNMSRGNANNAGEHPGYAAFSRADSYDAMHTASNPAASNFYDRQVWKLSSGDLIHDFAGNLWEWYYDLSSATVNPSYAGWAEYSSGSYTAIGISLNPTASATWNSTQGIGKALPAYIYTGATYAAFFGGSWSGTDYAGVFASYWGGYSPSANRGNVFGFRCVVPLP